MLAADPPGPDPRTRILLRGIAEGLGRSPLWHDLADPTADGRSAVRVVRTESYEAWVLGWLPGHSVELHDHGRSAAAFTVVEGSLVEIVAVGGHLQRHALPVGATREVPPGQRHDVLNLGIGPATSIHVYAPALTRMSFYDTVDGPAVRVEDVDDDGAVWPDVAAHRWLHPARAR